MVQHKAYATHRTPKRLRLKVPTRKKDAAYFSLIQEELLDLEGVEKVEVNPTTGSILIIKDPNENTVDTYTRTTRFFDFAEGQEQPHTPMETIAASFHPLDMRLRQLSGGELDLRNIVSLSLLGMAGYQLAIGDFGLPPWYHAIWFAHMLHIYRRDGVKTIAASHNHSNMISR
jgi:hypothetical protein